MAYLADNNVFDPATNELTYLGKGPYFPIQFTNTGSTRLAWCKIGGYLKIAHSVMQIIGTPLGSRYMLRDFGSNLEQLVFEPMNEALITMVNLEIAQPIRRWEPRIVDLTVDATIMEVGTSFEVKIKFKVAGMAGQGSLVFPFYRERGIGKDEVSFSVEA